MNIGIFRLHVLECVLSLGDKSHCTIHTNMRLLSHIRPATSLAMATSSGRYSSSCGYAVHSSFEAVVDLYDAFILDQFGVLHNGVSALDGATELCAYLHDQKNKKLMVLSNTSAPARHALAKLPKLGFCADHFVGAVTSGEESSRFIRTTYGKSQTTTTTTTSAKKALMFTWDPFKPNNPRLTAPPEAYLAQCGNVEVATCVADADFLLLHGSEIWYRGRPSNFHDYSTTTSLGSFIDHGGFEVIDPLLEECRARNLPAVCANPDLIVQTPEGGSAHMPGQIAQRYKDMGGECHVFGKPAVEHFEACIRELGVTKSRVAHVGDSLHHDIAGAAGAGISSVFITSGIHSQQLQTQFGEMPDEDVLERLLKDEGRIAPTHVVPAFRL